VNGSTRRAYRRLAARFGTWAEARSLEPSAALADQDMVAAYLVHVAATDGRLTKLQRNREGDPNRLRFCRVEAPNE